MTPAFVDHFDACLGCMACVTSCPSGVQYAPLIEATRAQIERRHPRSAGRSPVPQRHLRACSRIRAGSRLALLPLAIVGSAIRTAETAAIAEKAQSKIILLCVLSVLPGFPDGPGPNPMVRHRCRRVSRRCCRSRRASPGPRCSHRHQSGRRAGGEATDRRPADRLRAAAGVSARQRGDGARPRGGRMRRHRTAGAGLLRRAGAARRAARRRARLRAAHDRDVRARRRRAHRGQRRRLRIVDEGVRPAARRRSRPGRNARARFRRGSATSPRSCRSSARRRRRAIRSRCASPITTPVTSRTRRASVSRRAICCARFPASRSCRSRSRSICCGSAGIYNLVEPGPARELGDRKAAHIDAVKPDLIATANPGCMLQMSSASARLGRSMADPPPDRNPRRLDPRRRRCR